LPYELIELIFACIRKRLAIKSQLHKNQVNNSIEYKQNDYFVIPYVKHIRKIYAIFKKYTKYQNSILWNQQIKFDQQNTEGSNISFLIPMLSIKYVVHSVTHICWTRSY